MNTFKNWEIDEIVRFAEDCVNKLKWHEFHTVLAAWRIIKQLGSDLKEYNKELMNFALIAINMYFLAHFSQTRKFFNRNQI